MAPLKAMCIALIAAVLAATVAPPVETAVTSCDTVVFCLSGCLAYVTNTGPLGGCCRGVTKLYDIARTISDRQFVCRCIEIITATYPGIDFEKADGLRKACNVNVPYNISQSTDCSKVK